MQVRECQRVRAGRDRGSNERGSGAGQVARRSMQSRQTTQRQRGGKKEGRTKEISVPISLMPSVPFLRSGESAAGRLLPGHFSLSRHLPTDPGGKGGARARERHRTIASRPGPRRSSPSPRSASPHSSPPFPSTHRHSRAGRQRTHGGQAGVVVTMLAVVGRGDGRDRLGDGERALERGLESVGEELHGGLCGRRCGRVVCDAGAGDV